MEWSSVGKKQKQKETQELSVCQYTDYVVTGGAGGCHCQRQPLLQPVTIKLASWQLFIFQWCNQMRIQWEQYHVYVIYYAAAVSISAFVCTIL